MRKGNFPSVTHPLMIRGVRSHKTIASDGCIEIIQAMLEDNAMVIFKKFLLHELYDLESFKNQTALHQRLSKLRGVVTLVDSGVFRDIDLKEYGYFIHEFRHENLANSLLLKCNKDGKYVVDQCFQFALKLSSVLEEMQRNQIVHLGLCPANLSIGPTGEVSILSLESAVSLSNLLTASGTAAYLPLPFGPVAFLAPEVMIFINEGGRKPLDFNPFSASTYSIGVIIYQLLTQNPETQILISPAKDLPVNLSKVEPAELDKRSQVFLDIVKNVLLEPKNTNRVDYISLFSILDYIVQEKYEIIYDNLGLERTKTVRRMEFYRAKIEKMCAFETWPKRQEKPDVSSCVPFKMDRLYFPAIAEGLLIIVDYDKDRGKPKKVELKKDIGCGARTCMNANNTVYLLGGHSKVGNEFYGKLWEYSIDSHTYTERAEMKHRRSFFGMVNSSTFLFVVGGVTDWNVLQSAEYYDKAKNEWNKMGILNETKWSVSLTLLNTKILYCFGGYVTMKGVYASFNEESKISYLIERYDLQKFPDMWEKIEIPKSSPYIPRADVCSSLTLTNHILIFGGKDEKGVNKENAFIFDTATNSIMYSTAMRKEGCFEQQSYQKEDKIYGLSFSSYIRPKAICIHSAQCIDSSWIWNHISIEI